MERVIIVYTSAKELENCHVNKSVRSVKRKLKFARETMQSISSFMLTMIRRQMVCLRFKIIKVKKEKKYDVKKNEKGKVLLYVSNILLSILRV